MAALLLAMYPFMLLAGYEGELAHKNLQAFWEPYRLELPDHRVYDYHKDRLDHCIPFVIHGDEVWVVLYGCVMLYSISFWISLRFDVNAFVFAEFGGCWQLTS